MPADVPHAARTAAAGRCDKCGARLPDNWDDVICEHCAIVRALTVEQYRWRGRL